MHNISHLREIITSPEVSYTICLIESSGMLGTIDVVGLKYELRVVLLVILNIFLPISEITK